LWLVEEELMKNDRVRFVAVVIILVLWWLASHTGTSRTLTMDYVTSDNHFGHENIIHYRKRPFSNAQEMDDAMITNWNLTVGVEDTVFHLGDFTFGGRESALWYLRQLNGHIVMLTNRKHHDRRWIKNARLDSARGGFKGVDIVFVDPIYYYQNVIMCHFPLEEWPGSFRDIVHLHGHQHGGGKVIRTNRYDVSVENTDFTPIALSEAIRRARDDQ
jgi:calcineurin-like phosphoesterase family protein